jgi:hypothetical protein
MGHRGTARNSLMISRACACAYECVERVAAFGFTDLLARHQVTSSTPPCYKYKRRLVHYWHHFRNPINAALAMIEAAAPQDEIEGALAVQIKVGDGTQTWTRANRRSLSDLKSRRKHCEGRICCAGHGIKGDGTVPGPWRRSLCGPLRRGRPLSTFAAAHMSAR